MASEKTERNKWIDAVGKLISLTQERKLVWRASDRQDESWDKPKNIYEADYAGKVLKLSERGVLFLVEPGTDVEWRFPDTEATLHLLQAVTYQVVGVGSFLDDLLAETV